MNRLLFALALALAFLLASASAAPGVEAPAAVREMIAKHCVQCHGPTVQKANLRLDRLMDDFADPATFRMWVKVHDRVKAGEMPPRAKLDVKETAPALAALAGPLAAADRKRQEERGRSIVRRLNRVE